MTSSRREDMLEEFRRLKLMEEYRALKGRTALDSRLDQASDFGMAIRDAAPAFGRGAIPAAAGIAAGAAAAPLGPVASAGAAAAGEFAGELGAQALYGEETDLGAAGASGAISGVVDGALLGGGRLMRVVREGLGGAAARVTPRQGRVVDFFQKESGSALDDARAAGVNEGILQDIQNRALLPNELGAIDNPNLSSIVGVLESSRFSNRINTFTAARHELAESIADGYVKRLGPEVSPNELTDMVWVNIRNKVDDLGEQVSVLHDGLGQDVEDLSRLAGLVGRKAGAVADATKANKTRVRMLTGGEIGPDITGPQAAATKRSQGKTLNALGVGVHEQEAREVLKGLGLGAEQIETVLPRLKDVSETFGMVDMKPIKDAILRHDALLKPVNGAFSPLQTVIEEIKSLPDMAPFASVKDLRSNFSTRISTILRETAGNNDRLNEAQNGIRGAMTGALEHTLKRMDNRLGLRTADGLASRWQEANEATFLFKSEVKDEKVRKLLLELGGKSDGGQASAGANFLDSFYSVDNPREVARVRDLIGEDTEAWKAVQRYHAERELFNASGAGTSEASAKSLLKAYGRPGTVRDGVPNQAAIELYGKEHATNMVRVAESLAEFGRGEARRRGSVAVNLVESGMLLSVGSPALGFGAAGAAGAAAGAVTLKAGFEFLARRMTDPGFAKRFAGALKSMEDGEISNTTARFIFRLMAEASKNGDVTLETVGD